MKCKVEGTTAGALLPQATPIRATKMAAATRRTVDPPHGAFHAPLNQSSLYFAAISGNRPSVPPASPSCDGACPSCAWKAHCERRGHTLQRLQRVMAQMVGHSRVPALPAGGRLARPHPEAPLFPGE